MCSAPRRPPSMLVAANRQYKYLTSRNSTRARGGGRRVNRTALGETAGAINQKISRINKHQPGLHEAIRAVFVEAPRECGDCYSAGSGIASCGAVRSSRVTGARLKANRKIAVMRYAIAT